MTDVLHPPAARAAAQAIDELCDEWRARYGTVVCDVRPEPIAHGRLRLTGRVLLPAQRTAIHERVTAVTGGPLEDAITVLTERTDDPDWVAPSGERLDVHAAPDGELATQLLPSDPPARRLVRRDAWSALQLADGTVGWAQEDDLRAVQPADAPSDVDRWRTDFAGAPHAARADAWRAALEPWLGTPYLWGGTTRAGVDCSGLTQRLYRGVAGLGLPRHSTDQARHGRRVTIDELAPGDLLLLSHRQRGVSHVALVIDRRAELTVETETKPEVVPNPTADTETETGAEAQATTDTETQADTQAEPDTGAEAEADTPSVTDVGTDAAASITVAHASFEHGVTTEPLADMLARYRLRAARRLLPEAGA